MRHSPYSRHGAPAPLIVAAGLCLVEGIVVVAYGVDTLLHAGREKTADVVVGGLFLLGYGALLIWCARGLTRLRPWTRGPVLLSQLIALGLAWNLRSGGTAIAAAALLVLALAALVGLLHPRSIEALERARDDPGK